MMNVGLVLVGLWLCFTFAITTKKICLVPLFLSSFLLCLEFTVSLCFAFCKDT